MRKTTFLFLALYLIYAINTSGITGMLALETPEIDLENNYTNSSYDIFDKIESVFSNKVGDAAEKYGFVYYPNNPIAYTITDCTMDRTRKIEQGLRLIEEATNNVLTFNYEGEEIGIDYTCYPYVAPGDSGVAGTGGPGASYIGEHKVLDNGEVSFYILPLLSGREYYEECSYPHVELHETLHALGFDHMSSGIMNAEGSCDQLEPQIGECLEYIYSGGEQGTGCGNYNAL
jgi:ssRNA-specific RNase YbeY (16S rRNA maturation enzyme)